MESISDKNLDQLCYRIQQIINTSSMKLPEEYFYSSLSFCLTDAIFSMSVRYQSVRKVIKNLSSAINVPISKYVNSKPYTLLNFADFMSNYNDKDLAEIVFQNRQRTSSTNGILKASAVRIACDILIEHGITDFTHINEKSVGKIEGDFCKIKGQKSGISFKYFCMLAGDENLVKPDRMVCRFIQNSIALPKTPTPSQAEDYFFAAYKRLKHEYIDLTPRILDYFIWDFQRGIKNVG